MMGEFDFRAGGNVPRVTRLGDCQVNFHRLNPTRTQWKCFFFDSSCFRMRDLELANSTSRLGLIVWRGKWFDICSVTR